MEIPVVFQSSEDIELNIEEEIGEGTRDYNILHNKPTINGVEVSGNKMAADYGLATDLELQDAVDTLENASESVENILLFTQQVISSAEAANTTALQALEHANNAENESAETANSLLQMQAQIDALSSKIDSKVDDGYVESGYFYMTSDGTTVSGPHGPFAGGGGGGGDTNNAVLTVTNTTGWLARTVATGYACNVTLNWSSIEDEMPTGGGKGTAMITVNNIVKASYEVNQGNITIDLAPYCSIGANSCRVTISDVYGNARSITFTITQVSLSISSSFDVTSPYNGAFSFPYTPVGSVSKTVYFILDGQQLGTQTTSVSNRQMSYTIPAQSHGAHSLTVYFEASINGETVRSNELYFEFISVETMNSNVIITSSFSITSVDQYSTIIIPFRVYDPIHDTADVSIYINETLVSSQSVDRTEQNYSYRALSSGEITFTISAGLTIRELSFVVNPVTIDVEAETSDLKLYLNAQGRSNNEANRDSWVYTEYAQDGTTVVNTISAQFSNFTWTLDGWQTDSDGVNVLRLVDDARLTIPYALFENDFKSNGKTIEIDFATRDVSSYNATLLSCTAAASNDKASLVITPQQVTFSGQQTSLSTLYKENEHLRLSIVVEKQSENRLILFYINGIMSRAIQYASGERFSQLTPVNISIGSNDCGIDIYTIRVYDNSLTRQQIVDNWIADTQVGETMLTRYQHNQVYNESGEITIATLPSDLPYMILNGPELPQFKGDKKTITGSFVYPGNAAKSFTFEGCQINVQGTSSAIYYRKNYDLQFKSGFIMNTGSVAETYALRTDSIPFNRFVLKADVASSESANNTVLTMFYNDSCPYRTPEMIANSKVRYGIEGIPIVVFWYNPDDGTTSFMGKYNFNLPKRAPTPYGYSGNMESWEWQRNNSSNVKFQDNDFTSQSWDEDEKVYYPTWYDDFEARFPSDEWKNYAKLGEFLTWVKTTWRDEATNEFLTNDVYTEFEGDTFANGVTYYERSGAYYYLYEYTATTDVSKVSGKTYYTKESTQASVSYRLNTNRTVVDYTEDNSFTATEEIVDGQATGYTIFTFTKDTPAYRLTKFRAELSDYVEIDSALFYYLFTEMFLMIDSRAKNMFVGFDGGTITSS